MNRFWCFVILLAGLLAFDFSARSSQVQAQRRQAPTAKTATSSDSTQQPSTAGIPIYESSVSSTKAAPTRPASAQKRQLSPLDQLRYGDFTLLSLDGTSVPMGDLLAIGHPTLIQFWQLRCEQSHAQIAYMNEVADRYRQRGFMILALTIDNPEQRRNVSAFVRQEHINYPVYLAPPNLYRLMSGGAAGTPQTFVFSREGRIVNRLIGWEQKRGRPALEAALEAAK
jgi:hypothetical protein